MASRSKKEGASYPDGNDATLFPNGNNRQNTAENTLPEAFAQRVWKPGQSGNPGGRPAMSPEVKAALEGATLPAVQKQIELMNCGDVRVELLATQAILDRFYGKAAQAVDKTVTVTTVQQQHLNILMELQAKRDQAVKVIEAQAAESEQGEQKP